MASVSSISIQSFPKELFLSDIFTHLSAQELATISSVCKQWKTLASNEKLWKAFKLIELFPKLEIIDENTWKTYADLDGLGLSVDDIAPLDNRIVIPKIAQFFIRLKKEKVTIEGDCGVALMTVPKGSTRKSLGEFAQSPKLGNKTYFATNVISPYDLADDPVEKTYRILITRSILEGSRKQSSSDHKALVERIGCVLPTVLQAGQLAIMTCVSSPKTSPTYLFGIAPWICTRCSECIRDYSLMIGEFSPMYGLPIMRSVSDNNDKGVAAVLPL